MSISVAHFWKLLVIRVLDREDFAECSFGKPRARIDDPHCIANPEVLTFGMILIWRALCKAGGCCCIFFSVHVSTYFVSIKDVF